MSTAVLYALAGGAQGLAASRLRSAELEVADARAREAIARTLHDGVLQTLAIVQRRSTDRDLARLAHEQERELREYLFGTPVSVGSGGDLGHALRAAAARFEDRYGAAARVVSPTTCPPVDADVCDALASAVSEALTNAGKHGGAQTVTVYAEPDDGRVFCSVKDDGVGLRHRRRRRGRRPHVVDPWPHRRRRRDRRGRQSRRARHRGPVLGALT